MTKTERHPQLDWGSHDLEQEKQITTSLSLLVMTRGLLNIFLLQKTTVLIVIASETKQSHDSSSNVIDYHVAIAPHNNK
tara:strand:+ start:41536 stop:41772 length:237 start_codon:yes stop_codon:yes gene_type:complete